MSSVAVTWTQVSSHLRLVGTADEMMAMNYALAASEWCESYLNRALITQTLQFTVSDHVPIPNLYLVVLPLALTQLYTNQQQYCELPRAPVQSITSVVYNNTDGTQTATTDYIANLIADPGVVIINHLPTFGTQITSVEITYQAGYGDDPSTVPMPIQIAILMLTASMYERRGDADGDIPRVVTRLLTPYRLVTFS